jgi:hypothetical protein
LEPDKEREKDKEIMKVHLETLLLLSTTQESRAMLRQVKIYPIIRECHMHVDDDGVREACDRVVQVIQRREEGEEEDMPSGIGGIDGLDGGSAGKMVALQNEDEEEEDDDDKIVDIL